MAKMSRRDLLKRRERLYAALLRYHTGEGAYGARYLTTCINGAGLRIVLAPPSKRKPEGGG